MGPSINDVTYSISSVITFRTEIRGNLPQTDYLGFWHSNSHTYYNFVLVKNKVMYLNFSKCMILLFWWMFLFLKCKIGIKIKITLLKCNSILQKMLPNYDQT